LLVEGGPSVIGSFLKENLADEIIVYIASKILDAKGTADMAETTNKYLKLCRADIKYISDDVRINGLTENGMKAAAIPEDGL
jgi:riboflavin biosynthesis pyrimidine reductase